MIQIPLLHLCVYIYIFFFFNKLPFFFFLLLSSPLFFLLSTLSLHPFFKFVVLQPPAVEIKWTLFNIKLGPLLHT